MTAYRWESTRTRVGRTHTIRPGHTELLQWSDPTGDQATRHAEPVPDWRHDANMRMVAYLLEAHGRPTHPGPVATQPCGTPAAYRRHLRRGEDPCPLCRVANRQHNAQPGRGWCE